MNIENKEMRIEKRQRSRKQSRIIKCIANMEKVRKRKLTAWSWLFIQAIDSPPHAPTREAMPSYGESKLR